MHAAHTGEVQEARRGDLELALHLLQAAGLDLWKSIPQLLVQLLIGEVRNCYGELLFPSNPEGQGECPALGS